MSTGAAYGIRVKTSLDYESALQNVTDALRAEGFGVLTEIDVKATMKEKLGVDVTPYKILGACNPQLAHQALEAERDLGLLLPCNVIVYDEPDGAVVSVMDPNLMAKVTDNPDLEPIAAEARERLDRALKALGA